MHPHWRGAVCVLLVHAGANKRKGGRPGDMGHDEYGSGRFGGQLDREMQFFEKVKTRLRSKEQYQVSVQAMLGVLCFARLFQNNLGWWDRAAPF